jgi:hypothetical protein
MGTQRITERVAAPFTGSKVDRAAGTIDDVLICGTESANGRDYPVEVFRRDHAVYEGAMVNCDHGRESTVDRRFGWFTGVRPAADGRPRGRLNCLKSHPMFERVMEAAERNPKLFGFSHVAHCETTRRGGRDVVEAIKAVESIDLVAQPATTNGLFESRGSAVGLTVRKLAEALVKHPKVTAKQVRPLKWLGEMEGMDAAATTMDAAPADDADPADGIKGAFLTACMHLCEQGLDGEMDAKEALGKLKELFASHAKVKGEKPGEDDEEDEDEEYETPKESRRRPKMADLVAEAKAAGLKDLSAADLVVLEGITTEAGRKAYYARLSETGAETPRSGGKRPGSQLDPAPKGGSTQPVKEAVMTWQD